jgi:hypothetical protein
MTITITEACEKTEFAFSKYNFGGHVEKCPGLFSYFDMFIFDLPEQ